jgi:hypothetical protein
MTVSARQYATGAENIASAYAIRQRLLRPAHSVSDTVAKPAPPKPPIRMIYRDQNPKDAHVTAWRIWMCRVTGSKCKHYVMLRAVELGFTYDEITSLDRHKAIVRARQLVMWELKTTVKPDISWMEIGRLFGRDHTTAMHAVRKISSLKARGEI